MQPNPKPQVESRNESPFLAGIIAGVLLAVLWAFLVWFTHNGIALAAWGIGGLIGVTLAKSSGKPNASLGILAGGVTLGSVLLAKVLVILFALPQMSRDEIRRSPYAAATAFMLDMATHRSFSPELQAAIDSENHKEPDTLSSRGVELTYRMMSEAGERAAAATPAERERVIRTSTDRMLAQRGFLALLIGTFGVWDLTWLGLGMSTAWKVAIAGWVS